MVLDCLGLHTQNPRLREVNLEPRAKKVRDRSTCRNKEETPKRQQVVLYRLDLYGSQHLERQTWNPVLKEEPI